jgi:anti-sigma B factor antagonist
MLGFAQNGGLGPWEDTEALPSYRIDTYSTAPDDYVLALEGELDLAARSTLVRELERLHEHRPRCVVADLTETTFIDASTLGLLEDAQSRFLAAGSELRLVCTDGHVLRVIALLGINLVLDVYETVSEAFAASNYSNVVWLRHAAGG